jgi:hypothetical protein
VPVYTREDQIDVRVTLDGVPYGDSWDAITGGEGDSNPVKIRVGGKEINIGGPGTRADVQASIQMSDIVAGWIKTFDRRKGKGALKIAWSITDADYNILQGPFSYTGMLKTCTRPDMDRSNSSPGAAKFTITLSPDEDMA